MLVVDFVGAELQFIFARFLRFSRLKSTSSPGWTPFCAEKELCGTVVQLPKHQSCIHVCRRATNLQIFLYVFGACLPARNHASPGEQA
jgi:hypothetical protein